MQRFINPTAGMASVEGEVAVPNESSSTESECEHDNQDVRHGEQEEHPWPYLKSLFEFSMVKNANSTSKSYVFKCLLCLPKTNHITAFNNSTSNLKKHVDVSKHFIVGNNGLMWVSECTVGANVVLASSNNNHKNNYTVYQGSHRVLKSLKKH